MDVRKCLRLCQTVGSVMRKVRRAVGPLLLLPVDLNVAGTGGRQQGGILQLQQRHIGVQRFRIEMLIDDNSTYVVRS